MRSGQFRHQVTLLRRVDNQAPSGQVTHSYEPIETVMARVIPVSGREYFAAAQVQSEITTKIHIRWRSDVDETCRVKHEIDHSVSPAWFDMYDIKAALPDEKTGRRELVLMCTKNPADGWRGQ